MIIVGYQGIGKSTLASYKQGWYIDLESGNFFVDGKRHDDWYIVYCKIADHLSEQGYHVFVSSHAVVREYLAANAHAKKMIVYPALHLRGKWINRLKVRWENSGKDKDYRAYMNALGRYDDNIKELELSEGFTKVVIDEIYYDLHDLICDNIEV